MQNQSLESSVFINGKAQIIEMLALMTVSEREKLLKNVARKNPTVAQELLRESLTFDAVEFLGDQEWQILLSYIDPRILGMALKLCQVEFQKRVLRLASREYAQEAFNVLKTPYVEGKKDAKRAQKKIMEIISSLSRKGVISL